ncbi:ubiquitin carboxyl-terminal hydrolase 34 [Cinnamomum micranthum f. kanehirae]|uniref:Ubiquitin carboxyl-terminal hydrolase 34 n=1 Tax=Cinnamomum micranthum f. kanehirae TaxID=337451 RepID=A0A443N3T5_9MAGN|nr:ubiquitin carboxyl-terminal hydrolase 34 [Cinnamomum micranthum f. kanehirae]
MFNLFLNTETSLAKEMTSSTTQRLGCLSGGGGSVEDQNEEEESDPRICSSSGLVLGQEGTGFVGPADDTNEEEEADEHVDDSKDAIDAGAGVEEGEVIDGCDEGVPWEEVARAQCEVDDVGKVEGTGFVGPADDTNEEEEADEHVDDSEDAIDAGAGVEEGEVIDGCDEGVPWEEVARAQCEVDDVGKVEGVFGDFGLRG